MPRNQKHEARPEKSAAYAEREFIAWDGEGINLSGPGHPQSYVLFGSTEDCIKSRTGLRTIDCLEHIIATGQRKPRAIHVAFSFNYDANMICQGLPAEILMRLQKTGKARVKLGSSRFFISIARGKYFQVTKYLTDKKKVTVRIFDIFSFFACSFIKAYEGWVGPIPEIIKSGKKGRSNFSLEEFDEMELYWTVEVELMKELAQELRKRVYNANLPISQWYGPGALATKAMRTNGIKAHMADCGSGVREAARYAFAGGRFELYKCGRITDRIYSYDINSAYPFAISQLPSLAEGQWTHVTNPDPHKLARFGVYHVRQTNNALPFTRAPGILFHRDPQHNISFPWHVEGWYWTPEASLAANRGAELVEGWEYRGATTLPFDWIPEMYSRRQDWKARGISAQIALKLCMNSCYGKLAQRVGWTVENMRIPPFHQLEWAGWVTSYTRMKLFKLMERIPFSKLIAVETDGIFTTMPPEEFSSRVLDIGPGLGQWEVKEYDEMLYIQSGLAWMRDPDGNWSNKRRGLDPCRKDHSPTECDCPGTPSLNACRTYLDQLHAKPNGKRPWPPYCGETTRFVGMGQALAKRDDFRNHHCVWETVPREIGVGRSGKRVHMWAMCDACKVGATAYDMAHDLVINSSSVNHQWSTPHSIPWEGNDDAHADWRAFQDERDGYVYAE